MVEVVVLVVEGVKLLVFLLVGFLVFMWFLFIFVVYSLFKCIEWIIYFIFIFVNNEWMSEVLVRCVLLCGYVGLGSIVIDGWCFKVDEWICWFSLENILFLGRWEWDF